VRLAALRDRLHEKLRAELPGVLLNGPVEGRLPANLNLSFEGVRADELLPSLHDVALSTGSACASARGEPSHVLRALGLSAERAAGAVRFGLGRDTTEAEIDAAAARVAEEARKAGSRAGPLRRPGRGG
ncbi:MAG: aminotransferase class V-fold PLP-dependent enzyme, partial [Myxococcota bacterium]